MYETFYNLSEKPFTLLPDPSFLYMSDKHRMAFSLLEYGLMNHAGFTVISGDIGAGKTTLIRHLLDNMDREHTVGLISNTHQSFGELLHWILLAFNLEHADMNKVEMYQKFIEFIIDEYAHNRRTVLIVDEAQNMSAETLEELRMLSNVNADKDQALQVVLVGQNELRDTLKSPDLVQFAQRIAVDYHLKPLSEEETANYIRHRLRVVGGRANIFSDPACKAVHLYSNGVPRLINLLCDTALVYGFAEGKHRIDANLVTQVAKEKQEGGIFPTFHTAQDDDFPAEEPLAAEEIERLQARSAEIPAPSQAMDDNTRDTPVSAVHMPPTEPATATPLLSGGSETADHTSTSPKKSEGELYWERQAGLQPAKKKVRIVLFAEKESLNQYLSRLLESFGFEVIQPATSGLQTGGSTGKCPADILLIDRTDNSTSLQPVLSSLISEWQGPVLYHDAAETEISLQRGDTRFGKALADRIVSLVKADQEIDHANRKAI